MTGSEPNGGWFGFQNTFKADPNAGKPTEDVEKDAEEVRSEASEVLVPQMQAALEDELSDAVATALSDDEWLGITQQLVREVGHETVWETFSDEAYETLPMTIPPDERIERHNERVVDRIIETVGEDRILQGIRSNADSA